MKHRWQELVIGCLNGLKISQLELKKTNFIQICGIFSKLYYYMVLLVITVYKYMSSAISWITQFREKYYL